MAHRLARIASGACLLVLVVLVAAALATSRSRLEDQASSGEVRHVRDARGKDVRVPLPFRGSVTYAGIVLPNYLLVSRDPGAIADLPSFIRRGGLQDQLISKVYPAFARREGSLRFGGVPVDIEWMLWHRPSAIITWAASAGRFEAFGLPVVGVENTQKEEEIFDCVRIYAETVGDPGRGEALVASTRRRNEAVASELGPLADDARPRVLAIYLSSEGRIRASYGRDHVVSAFWHRGGARNAVTARRAAVDLDVERIHAMDPDVILLTGLAPLTPDALRRLPQWRSLRAVRDGRVYRQPPGLDGFMWNIVDSPLYARWIAELLHPDRMAPTLRQEMKRAYRDALGYEASDADIDSALAVPSNAGSLGYRRFAARAVDADPNRR